MIYRNMVLSGRLHICLLTSSRIFEKTIGGESKFTISLANWLVSANHDVTLMGSGFATAKSRRLSGVKMENEDNNKSKHAKAKTLSVPYFIYSASRLAISIIWFLKILSTHIRFPISLIHAQDTGYAGLAAIVSGKLLGIPVIVSSHGIRHKTLEANIRGIFKNILLKTEYRLDIFTINNSNNIIADNPSIKRYLEHIVSKKIDVIPPPINVNNFEFSKQSRYLIRKEFGIDENDKIVGFVGRFASEKNLFTLLTSFSTVAQNDPSIKLVLVGGGPLKDQLKEFIRKKNLEEKVIFCGIRYDVDKILSSFDIFVLPSYTEGSSIALLEAMASARAIICSDIPTNREVITHNQEALLVDPYDEEDLKKAIEALAGNDILRSKLGHNANLKAKQYDEEIIFTYLLLQYKRLISKKS